MKKLLTIFGTIGLCGSLTAGSVVSCGKNKSFMDLSKFDGSLIGSVDNDDNSHNISVLYDNVGNLRKAIIFELGINPKIDLNSSGIIIKSGESSGPSGENLADDVAISSSDYYFITLKASAISRVLLPGSSIEEKSLQLTNKKYNLKNLKTVFSALTESTVADSNQQLNNQIPVVLKEVMGINTDIDVSNDFIDFIEKPVFNFADSVKIITKAPILSVNYLTANENSSKLFSGKIRPSCMFNFNIDDISNKSFVYSDDVSGTNLTDAEVKAIKSQLLSELVTEVQSSINAISEGPNVIIVNKWDFSYQEATSNPINTSTSLSSGDNVLNALYSLSSRGLNSRLGISDIDSISVTITVNKV